MKAFGVPKVCGLTKHIANTQGVVQLCVAAIIALLALGYGIYTSNLIPNIGAWADHCKACSEANPEKCDLTALQRCLQSTVDTAGPAPIPTDSSASGVAEWVGYNLILNYVKNNIDTPTPPSESRGNPSQTGACSINVDNKNPKPNDYVTITIIIPRPFRHRVGRTHAEAAGVSLYLTGGPAVYTCPWKVPPGPSGVLTISFTAIAKDGSCLCTAVETVTRKDSSCVPPECCSERPIACGDMCIPSGYDCCDGQGACPPGEKCCANGCIPVDGVCCETGGWCNAGWTCCHDGGCCPPGTYCCGPTKCCPL